jgi:tyrosyl-tRNA synthetase
MSVTRDAGGARDTDVLDGASDALELLRRRGFVQDVTDEDALRAAFASGPVTYYVGFDPTAPSLHAGNLVGMMAMAWLQRAGHRPIAIAGGGTGRIGDPSGRDTERTMLDEDALAANLAGIRRQLGAFLDLDEAAGGGRGFLVDNHGWLKELDLLGFLRDVGVHVPLTAMLGRESVKRRLEGREQGITFTEFVYQLLQAYDFAHLYREHGCVLQGGGSDQWGNITAGIELTRRLHGGQVFGLVWPLLTTADGAKFGKSAGNAVWLDATMTSPYAYYQYWFNAADADVDRFLRLFTFLPLADVAEVVAEHERDPAARHGQRVLAREATRILHGDAGVEAAERATDVLFGDEPYGTLGDEVLADAFGEAPSVELPRARLDEGVGLLELMTLVGASASNGEARRLVQQGAVRINNAIVDDAARIVTAADLAGETTVVLRAGRKRHFLARFV